MEYVNLKIKGTNSKILKITPQLPIHALKCAQFGCRICNNLNYGRILNSFIL